MNQDRQVAVVTGATRGLGRAISQRLTSAGWSLVITGRTEARVQQTAEQLSKVGCEVLGIAGDIADPEHLKRVFDKVEQHFGRLDLLVNNAGTFEGGPLDELSLQDWDRVMATNLRGPFLATQLAFRIMKPQGSGRIINIGSISAQRVRPYSAAYSTTKHGLWGLTQVTALEGREFGITCGCLNPGNILTERRQASPAAEDQEPMMACEEVAEVVMMMASLPPHVELLEATVLPHQQLFVGRG